jgi:hypothetical protein
LSNALRALLFDWHWELREASLGCIMSILQVSPNVIITLAYRSKQQTDLGLDFAVTHSLHALTLQKLSDGESYVRSATLQALQALTSTQKGWQAYNTLVDGTFGRILVALEDSEAFVRRYAQHFVEGFRDKL